jgi:hypothetical protein
MYSEAVCSKSDNYRQREQFQKEAIGDGSRLALASPEKPDEALPSSAIKNPMFTRATMLLQSSPNKSLERDFKSTMQQQSDKKTKMSFIFVFPKDGKNGPNTTLLKCAHSLLHTSSKRSITL